MAENSRTVRLMHVTTIPGTLWGFLGGQIGYMKARGLQVHAISSPEERLKQLAEREQIPIHGIRIERKIKPFRDMVTILRLWRELRRLRPHILQLGTPKASLLGAIAAWAARVPVRIFMWHGSITENVSGLNRVVYWCAERLTAKLCHQTISVSPSLLSYCRKQGLVGPTEGIVILNGMCNGIDTDRFSPHDETIREESLRIAKSIDLSSDSIVIGFVGRLAFDKGVDELAAAWRLLREELANLHLLVLGDWEKENPVCTTIRAALENDSRVHLIGRVEDVVPFYKLMDVLVLPTHGTEGFPTVPMEAAAMGIPTVTTRVVGAVDAVEDGVTGTLVPARDAAALAHALRRYLADPELRQQHGQAGRERVLQDFRPEDIWEALYQEYVRLLREKGLPVPHPAAQSKEEAGVSKA